MKKILFVSTRNPYSGRYSGDVIRSFKIINLLKKKYEVDVAYLGKKNNDIVKGVNLISYNQPNLFEKIFYCFISLLKFEPMQFGLFFSKSMKNYISENSQNYDLIFFLSAGLKIFREIPPPFGVFGIKTIYFPAIEMNVLKAAPF